MTPWFLNPIPVILMTFNPHREGGGSGEREGRREWGEGGRGKGERRKGDKGRKRGGGGMEVSKHTVTHTQLKMSKRQSRLDL